MVYEEDLAKLRARIIKLEAQVNFLYKKLNIEFVPETQITDDPKIVEFIKKGQILEAIKVRRQNTGEGLAEAKAAVEEMQGRLGL
jgi:ribosomal protein L7/L12